MALKASARIIIALLAMLFFTYLFCLPGSDLPKEDWFSKIPLFDKWVHTGIFFTIICVWSWAMQLFRYKQLSILLLLAALYGFLIEVVQYQFIPGRSFDLADLGADVTGSFIGLFFWLQWKRYKKNRPL